MDGFTTDSFGNRHHPIQPIALNYDNLDFDEFSGSLTHYYKANNLP